MQHNSLSLFKEMLLTLDLAQKIGSPSDKIAADKLSRRYVPFTSKVTSNALDMIYHFSTESDANMPSHGGQKCRPHLLEAY